MARKFTKYPTTVMASTDVDSIKAYIKELVDQGETLNLIFTLGGRYPNLTIHEFTNIISEMWRDEGFEIPGVIY